MGSIGNEMRFAHEKADMIDAAHKALKRCHKQEKQAMAQGYRNVRINKFTEILVPCDKNGNPTKVGQKKIETMRKYLGI
jgi:hypothetical protein